MTHGASRDPERKVSPFLLPWSQLPEVLKDQDKNAVRQIPELLKLAGFEVYQLH